MATVRDMVKAALTELNVLAAGQDPDAQQAQDGMDALNRLIDAWATEPLQIYTMVRTVWTIVSGTGTYTVGTGGTVNTPRPIFIDHVSFLYTSPTPTVEYPLEPLTDEEWEKLSIKGMTSALPTYWWYDAEFPLGDLRLWPIPTDTTLQGVLYSLRPVQEFTGLTDTVALPPGYRRMIVKNLALEMAPSFSRQIDQVLFKQANDAKSDVKRANQRLFDLSFEAGALIGGHGGLYNIRTDSYR